LAAANKKGSSSYEGGDQPAQASLAHLKFDVADRRKFCVRYSA
jgi:hypothetical protein